MRSSPFFFLVPALILLPVMVSNQSFWIDEGSTGLFAREPDFTSWWRHLEINSSSETQMPLMLFLAWLWAKVAGSGEWGLRSLNLVWGACTLVATALVGRRLRLPWLPLFCAIQPYFWYYTGEARSYAFQIALGAWLLHAFVGFVQETGSEFRWYLVFTILALVLACTTMLAPFALVSIAVVASIFLFRTPGRRIGGRCLGVIGFGALLSVPIGMYYLGTLAKGAKGAELWTVDIKYLGYIFYETAGLTGLGPATADLREIARSFHGLSSLTSHGKEFALPLLCTGALGVLVVLGRRGFRSSLLPHAGILLGVFLLGTGFFLIASLAAQKAFWGRHYAPLFPFLITGIAVLIREAGESGGKLMFSIAASLYFPLLLFSGLSMRFADRHQKDDYRSAATLATRVLKEGKSVWWVAAPEAAEYYGLPLTYAQPEQGMAFCPQVHTGIPGTKELSRDVAHLPLPDVVVTSKPNTFDLSNAVTPRLNENKYAPVAYFRTFTVWAAPGVEVSK